MEAEYTPGYSKSPHNSPQHITIHALQPEIILLITLHARVGSVRDLYTLRAISQVCKRFNAVLRECKAKIIRHYTVTVMVHGCICTRLFGWPHSIDDKPSMVDIHYGRPPSLYWHLYGKLHRGNDKPASIHSEAQQAACSWRWYWHDKLHREGDKPASVWGDGSRYYYRMGVLHREGGPAVIRSDGTWARFIYGKQIL